MGPLLGIYDYHKPCKLLMEWGFSFKFKKKIKDFTIQRNNTPSISL